MSHGQADNQFLLILKGQSNNSNLTDPVKQTVRKVLPLKRPAMRLSQFDN